MTVGGQTTALLRLLRERGDLGVTPLEALDRIGSFRLGARVYDLRRAGYPIRRDWATMPDGARVARYVLEESPVPVPAGRDGRVESWLCTTCAGTIDPSGEPPGRATIDGRYRVGRCPLCHNETAFARRVA